MAHRFAATLSLLTLADAFHTFVPPGWNMGASSTASVRLWCCLKAHRRSQCSDAAAVRMHVDPIMANVLIGGISGTVSNMCVFPAELVKTKMQNAVSAEEKLRYHDVVSTVSDLTAEKGILGLWDGSTAVLLGSAPESAIQLATHSFLIACMRQHAFPNDGYGAGLEQQVIAGALAGAATLVATNPMEVLRLHATEGRRQHGSIADAAASLGISGLFTGSSATLLRDIPFAALYYTLYFEAKTILEPLFAHGGSSHAWMPQFLAGLISGAIASLSTTPCDVIKTRVQSKIGNIGPKAKATGARRLVTAFATEVDLVPRTSVLDEAKRIVSAEGAHVLMRGSGLRVAKIAPRMAICLVLFETLQNLVV